MPDVLVDVAREFRAAYESASWAMRGEIMEEYCRTFGWSRNKAFNVLKAAGWASGRKPRADKGAVECGISEETINTAASMLYNSKRKTERIIIPTWKAIEVLEDNGVLSRGQVSPATLNRLLRDRNIARKNLLAPESTVQLRSLHPNHVHELDSSVCVQYDFGKKGRLMDRNMQMEFYKNKPGYWKTVKKVLLRYLLTDHYSGAFFAHYYYVSGENSTSLLDFTLKAWGKKPEPSKYPFHGVPLILMVDKGSANLSAVYNSFCSNLGVELLDHVPGRANVNGQVEGMHAFWERAFESELSLLKAENLDELNARALDYAMYLNALKIHKRTKASRSGFWASMIRKDQLRELPPIEVCRTLATTQPYTAVVQANKLITFKLPGAAKAQTYQLTGPFQKKDKVTVVIRPYDLVDGIPNIEVSDKNGELFPCKLIKFDAAGYKADGPVIGESYARHEFNPAERFKADFNKEKKEALADIVPQLQRPKLDKIEFFIKEGEEVAVNRPAPVLPVSAYDARKRIREALGLDRFTTLQSQLIDRKLTQEVIDESELETLIEEFKTRFGGASTIPAAGRRKEAQG
jgi:hypothetical protein